MTRPESQPRHPLALLADGWEARARLLTENARAEQNEQSARYYAARAAEAQDCAAQLREALRAQAEAEAGLREALNRIACAWTITANSLYVNGGTEFDAGKAAGLAQASESLTRTCAALAQAGG